ncbi:putative mediator of RNA polymerase II transcription subunit 26 isoform X3 [Drosophila sulfurigaster albostrigata]|uniref:putative mediator of RNA polymerase II transcription subunit 26 isoform X3 n=1 Tax=Drosophila sulfurigaster albostrigata TaxID=89887 RepID=UPI002D21E867|nr:putative mediator of RNA polymerase II transcription subunit 26 isoform X3 [Drosophila sulfurigaster albostrigata]
MDFLSNLIKRPSSIMLPIPETDSLTTNSASSETTSSPPPPPQVNLIMDRCNIDTELENLFDSAAKDLNSLGEQHNLLIDDVDKEPEVVSTPSSPRETIQQLLSEINVNLDQVTAHEMEHLQAMSLELSPLVVKASPRHNSIEQQKALAAAAVMRTASQPGTPTMPTISGDLFQQQDVESGIIKFAGLPEFDEAQIPELAPLRAEMETQLIENVNASTAKSSDRDYNSDSDVFAECLSMNSAKISAEHSDLEAYSSALNEVLETQFSNVTATTLENTLNSEQHAAALSHNDSCEPMDIDEIAETIEILNFSPEDQQFLQQQLQSIGMQPDRTNKEPQLDKVLEKQIQSEEQKVMQQVNQQDLENHQPLQNKLDAEQHLDVNKPPLDDLENQLLVQQLNSKQYKKNDSIVEDLLAKVEPILKQHDNQLPMQQMDSQHQEKNEPIIEDLLAKVEPLLKQHDDKIREQLLDNLQHEQNDELKLEQQLLEKNEECQQESAQLTVEVPASPPIPTHRSKTLDELQEQMVLQQFDQPSEEIPSTAQQPTTQITRQLESTLDAVEEKPMDQNDLSEQQAALALPVSDMKPLQLNMVDSSHEGSTTPTSPSFPIKEPEIPCHFPRSPHAPPEREEMPYLEQAVIEPSIEHQLHLSGAIAKFPLPIQVTVTQPSPEKPTENQQLSTTISMDNGSPMNETFNGTQTEFIESDPQQSHAVFGVPLGEAHRQQRRTFSLNDTTRQAEQPPAEQSLPLNATIAIKGESPLNDTYALPLNAVKDRERQTFTISDLQQGNQGEDEQGIKKSSSPVDVDKLKSRLTFSLEQNASPAMEATEENIMGNELEPMDVDISMRAEPASAPAPLSPPIPTHQTKQLTVSEDVQPREQLRETKSPPIPTHRPKDPQRQTHSPPIPTHKPPPQLKRPSIHEDVTPSTSAVVQPLPSIPNATVLLEEQKLSAKEQLSASDEKDDVFVEHFGAISPISDDIFKAPQYSSSSFSKMAKGKSIEPAVSDSTKEQFYDAEFQDGANDNNNFDYLYTKGSNNAPIDRSSLLLKFDPLLGAPVPVNQSQHQQEQTLLNILSNNNNLARALSPTLEEHETSGSNQSFVIEPSAKTSKKSEGPGTQRELQIKPPVDRSKKHAKMSVDVIDNDCNKPFDNSNLNSEDKTNKYNNMDELEKKIKNEVTRSEDIEKKLKDAEQREEALVKRITDKDKTNTKLNGVIEAYEKAIAELIHDKEQLVQNHEREMQEVQTDRDSNYHHLTSLETTFSDLHVKYEKSKEMTSHLKQIEENLLDEKKKLQEKLRQQEQRYEQMKSHAMQQMEIANKKLATISKEHTDEVKKLKALLKKEEVSRISTAEQLQQKSRENADLLKICEELIYDKGQGGSS